MELENEQIINQLMNEYGGDVLRTAFFFVKDKTVAEDIFQEVFIKVYKRLDTFRNEANLKTWILQITINQCKDYLKSGWFKRILSSVGLYDSAFKDTDADHTPEKTFINQEEKHELHNEVLKLSLPLRVVIILHYYHDYNESEITSILKIPQGTVRSRLHRAKIALKKQLKGVED